MEKRQKPSSHQITSTQHNHDHAEIRQDHTLVAGLKKYDHHE